MNVTLLPEVNQMTLEKGQDLCTITAEADNADKALYIITAQASD